WLGQRSEGRTVILDKCVVNIYMSELQKHYASLRPSAISGDTAIEVRLLDKALNKNVKEGQSCCFIRLVLRFFVERVFVNFSTAEAHEQRGASAVANGFISLRNNIHKCHCQCEEETQRLLDSVIAEFDKLEIAEAAKKAVGELDTVLEWLEEHSQRSRTRK
ncbi:interleukin 19 like, partial [Boleophthalmus pectinirostris]|uniref:interleukin 19 like n=1 Tax=Boleophthalmus pectinirostris TaxID=150288 RepID=UPI00242FEFFF